MLVLRHGGAESPLSSKFRRRLYEGDICILLQLADKHDCVQAVRFAVSERLRAAVARTIRRAEHGELELDDLFNNLTLAVDASFIMRDVTLFKEISVFLTLRSSPAEQFASIVSKLALLVGGSFQVGHGVSDHISWPFNRIH